MSFANPRGRDRFRWIEAVLASADLLPAEKLLLTRIGLHCNPDDGRCDPSEATLAVEIHLSPRYVRIMKSSARRKGWIGYDKNPGGVSNGKGISNQYTLLMDLVPKELTRKGSSGFEDLLDKPVEGATRNAGAANPELQGQQPGTLVPPNNHQYKIHNNGGSDGSTRARSIDQLVDEIGRIAGLPLNRSQWPRYWRSARHEVEGWREQYPSCVILAGVRAAISRKRDGPPVSPRYFQEPIRRAYEAHMRQGRPQYAHPRATHQRYLADIARKLGKQGWGVLTELSELEAEDLVQRWSAGLVADGELHQLKADVERRLAVQPACDMSEPGTVLPGCQAQ
jgi:hypothetical protein